MMKSDGTHPNTTGLSAMANEWLFRIAAITVRPDRVVTPFIVGGSNWKYSDQGLDLGTNWTQPQYDDSAWAEGPGRLGYNTPGVVTTVSFGTNSADKYITTYFRRTFVAPANVLYTNLALRLNRVDGAIVWLNGQEIFRTNLPAGPISYLDRATTVIVGDSMSTYFPATVPIASLPPGTNVVAVEVHRASPSQASLSFDLELFGTGSLRRGWPPRWSPMPWPSPGRPTSPASTSRPAPACRPPASGRRSPDLIRSATAVSGCRSRPPPARSSSFAFACPCRNLRAPPYARFRLDEHRPWTRWRNWARIGRRCRGCAWELSGVEPDQPGKAGGESALEAGNVGLNPSVTDNQRPHQET